MKRTVAIIALVLALTMSLFVAACETNGGGRYKVTLDFDSTQGTVAVTNAEGEAVTEFEEGESAVITVTPKDGYVLLEVKVNGEKVETVDNKCTIKVTADCSVSVTFKQKATDDNVKPTIDDLAEALKSVKTTFKASGHYNYVEKGEEAVVNNVTTIFGNGAVHLTETDFAGEVVYFDDIYVDLDGKIAAPYRTINNTIEYVTSNNDELFSEYDNPFKLLTAADFAETDEAGIFALTDMEKARDAATAITGYNESVKTFEVEFDNGKITRVFIETNEITLDEEAGTSYNSSYVFEITEWGTADVDRTLITPFERVKEHDDLEAALKKATQAKNYTLYIFETEEGYDDLAYYSYVTETAVYDDCEGWEAGYVQSDGKVYPFEYDPETQTVTLTDPIKFPTIASMRASFDGFAAELFEYQGDGVFVLRDNSLVGDILISFADDYDKIQLYLDYSLNAKITVKDGTLYQLELDYYVYGMFVHRTITYSNFNTTEMPISFDNVVKTSVFDSFVGTYSDGEHTAVITTEHGIVIDGEAFEYDYFYSDYSIFEGTWKGETFYVEKQSQRQILVYNDDESVCYTLNMVDFEPVAIPEDFQGAWKGTDKDEQEHLFNITDSAITLDGEDLTVMSYTESEGLTAVLGSLTYNFTLVAATETTDKALSVLIIADGYKADQYTVEASNDIVIPSLFIGTFAGENTYVGVSYKAVISQDGITVTFGSQEKTATVEKLEEEESWGVSVWSLYVLIDEKEYVFAEGYSAGQLNFGSVFDSYASVSVTLKKVEGGDDPEPDVTIPAKYYGVFCDSERQYLIYIHKDGIEIYLDGEECEVVIIAYDDYEGFTVTVDGAEYYFYDEGNSDDVVAKIRFMSADYGTNVVLNRDTEADPDVPSDPTITIPKAFYGMFSTNDDTYIIIIDADGIMISINGEDCEVVITDYDDYEGFTVTVDGDVFYLMNSGYEDTVDGLAFMSEDFRTVNVVLSRDE